MITRTDMIAWGFGEGTRNEGEKMWQWIFDKRLKIALLDDGALKANVGNCCAFLTTYKYSATKLKALFTALEFDSEAEMVNIS